MNHTTDTVATLDTTLALLRRRRQRSAYRAGWIEGQRPMTPVAIVMFHEDVEELLKMLIVRDQQPVD